MSESRLDLALIERGLASTRTKAQDLIQAGCVLVDGKVARKAGEKVSEHTKIEITEEEYPYVSRGGLKLEHALKIFKLDVKNKIVLDIGQSTGGFTHCLLLNGVEKVIGIDVGRDQLAESLKNDPRVISYEQQDIRELSEDKVGLVDLFTCDLSFISLSQILPNVPKFLKPGAEGVLLVKPQFELSRNRVKNGIVKGAAAHEDALKRVVEAALGCGFMVKGQGESPITGGDGNKEFLLHVMWPQNRL